ncbi:MAG: RNA-binding cell elongation regulator Jag/EloR [Gallibacter sp.]|nr:RNA-binding cell elongation regulator Jag/EloR [Gallibacter sp.]
MNFSEKWGKDIEEATNLALDYLNCTIDEVEVEVLEEPSKGFLGIGSKLAKVRVTKKEKIEEKQPEEVIKEEQLIENCEEKLELEVLEEDSEGVIFLKELTDKMGFDLSFTEKANEENLFISITGKDASHIIGKRGQTLDAVQYLTSLVVNKDKENYKRVVLDVENYREKRKKTLENLADKTARKVVKIGRTIKLEPMNPYERMIIHSRLSDDSNIVTKSEGEEPYRRVVIEAK